jgi:hypothetical protein
MQVLQASPNHETPIDLSACGERQQLKQLEDDISDVILAIEATIDTIASLIKCLRNTASLNEPAACQQDCSTDAAILDAFNEKAGDVALIAQTARALRDKLQSTTQVVSNTTLVGEAQHDPLTQVVYRFPAFLTLGMAILLRTSQSRRKKRTRKWASLLPKAHVTLPP